MITRLKMRMRMSEDAIAVHNLSPLCLSVRDFLFPGLFFDLESAWDTSILAQQREFRDIHGPEYQRD